MERGTIYDNVFPYLLVILFCNVVQMYNVSREIDGESEITWKSLTHS